MPLCGFNQEMADGLQTFGQGISVQTEKRAVDECVPLVGIPAIELSELDVMVERLKASPKQAELEGIFGLTLFVRYLYRSLAEMQKKNPSVTAADAFKAIVGETNAIMFEMEDNYYDNLRPNHPRPEAIALMTKWLEARVR